MAIHNPLHKKHVDDIIIHDRITSRLLFVCFIIVQGCLSGMQRGGGGEIATNHLFPTIPEFILEMLLFKPKFKRISFPHPSMARKGFASATMRSHFPLQGEGRGFPMHLHFVGWATYPCDPFYTSLEPLWVAAKSQGLSRRDDHISCMAPLLFRLAYDARRIKSILQDCS